MHPVAPSLLLALGSLTVQTTVHAGPSQGSVGLPGGYATACARAR